MIYKSKDSNLNQSHRFVDIVDWNRTAHSARIRYQERKGQQTQREDDDSGDGKRQTPRVFDKGASDERASNVTNAVM